MLSVKGSPANLIARGVLTRVPPDAIDAFFAERGELRVAPSQLPFWRFQDVDLDEVAQNSMARVDGSGTLMDLLPLDERSRRLLYPLSTIEMIEFEVGKRRAPAAQAARVPAREARPAEKPALERPLSAAERPVPASAERPRPVAQPLPPAAPISLPPEPRRRAPADDASLSPEDEPLRVELARMAGAPAGPRLLRRPRRHPDGDGRRDPRRLLRPREAHPPGPLQRRGDALRRAAEELFALVSRAYETLGHRDRRNEYLRAETTRERDRAESRRASARSAPSSPSRRASR